MYFCFFFCGRCCHPRRPLSTRNAGGGTQPRTASSEGRRGSGEIFVLIIFLLLLAIFCHFFHTCLPPFLQWFFSVASFFVIFNIHFMLFLFCCCFPPLLFFQRYIIIVFSTYLLCLCSCLAFFLFYFLGNHVLFLLHCFCTAVSRAELQHFRGIQRCRGEPMIYYTYTV